MKTGLLLILASNLLLVSVLAQSVLELPPNLEKKVQSGQITCEMAVIVARLPAGICGDPKYSKSTVQYIAHEQPCFQDFNHTFITNCNANQSKGMIVSEFKESLMGKSKSYVKSVFGLPDDSMEGARTARWDYEKRISVYDPDSEKTYRHIVFFFNNEGRVSNISFQKAYGD